MHVYRVFVFLLFYSTFVFVSVLRVKLSAQLK